MSMNFKHGIAHHGNCLDIMKTMKDNSIDMILADLPYGTTKCKWDIVLPFEELWEQFNRIAKPNAAMIFTATQPFTSMLIMSNIDNHRYNLIWDKVIAPNFMCAKKQPMRNFEDIVVFYRKQPTYHPQMRQGKPFKDSRNSGRVEKDVYGSIAGHYPQDNSGTRYPNSIIQICGRNNAPKHPTQKPVALYEYLIKTYSNEGDTIFDPCAGSHPIIEATLNTNRKFVSCEIQKEYLPY